MSASTPVDLQVDALAEGYRAGGHPTEVVDLVYQRIGERGDDQVWITLRERPEVREEAARLARRWPDPEHRPPLFGIPYAVKDNVDVAGLPTTAACPDFEYQPEVSAPLVERLREAGALLIGKTNLDQFATGLVGTRSPYGAPVSPFDPDYISGGSSSGSAVAVSVGLVSFAIGTDTAGSGRVPAALCNVVGLKPSRGLVSTDGIVPACRSLDCASVFALSVADAARVLHAIADPVSPSRLPVPPATPRAVPAGLRVGVPAHWEFGGDQAARALFEAALERLAGTGARLVPVDLEPFLAAGRLLYDGPWVAERWADLGQFVEKQPESVHPVTRRVLRTGAAVSGADVFEGMHRLRRLRRQTERVWAEIDTLLVPTVPTTFTFSQVAADPVSRNAFLGYYTQFCNLLDLAAVAVPNGFTDAGLPFGVSLLAPAGADGLLAAVAQRFHLAAGVPVGATGVPPRRPPEPVTVTAGRSEQQHAGRPGHAGPQPDGVLLAVVGTHRTGQPLHPRLAALGAEPVGTAHTAEAYRLYALPNGGAGPDRPGLVRTRADGARIEVELHRIPVPSLGELLTEVPPPLGLGTVALSDGIEVLGFLCEGYAARAGKDITEHHSWPRYLASLT